MGLIWARLDSDFPAQRGFPPESRSGEIPVGYYPASADEQATRELDDEPTYPIETYADVDPADHLATDAPPPSVDLGHRSLAARTVR